MLAWPRYVSAGYGLRLPAYQSWRIGSDRQCVGAGGVPTGHSAQLAGWPGVAVTYFLVLPFRCALYKFTMMYPCVPLCYVYRCYP